MTNPSVIRINPALDPAPFAAVYQRDGVVQIPVFLDPVDAEGTAGIIAGLTWNVVAPDKTSETLVISLQVIQKFGETQVRQFLQGALKRASRGRSFIHLSYALQDEYAHDPTAPFYRAVYRHFQCRSSNRGIA